MIQMIDWPKPLTAEKRQVTSWVFSPQNDLNLAGEVQYEFITTNRHFRDVFVEREFIVHTVFLEDWLTLECICRLFKWYDAFDGQKSYAGRYRKIHSSQPFKYPNWWRDSSILVLENSIVRLSKCFSKKHSFSTPACGSRTVFMFWAYYM